MAGPFTIETTYPAVTDIQSQFPAHEQTFRQTVWDWLNVFSDPANGALKTSAFATFLAAANTWTGKQTFDDIAVSGAVDALSVTGALSVGTTLGVTGAATLSGNATIGGTLSVTGAVTLAVPLALAQGGTGSTTQGGARTALGLGSLATQNANSVSITGGTITGITDLAIADGGTGAGTVAGARTNIMGISTSTDNAVARYNGTTGAIQNSGVTIDDLNNISTPGDITYTSDIRVKSDIVPISGALDKIRQIGGYKYHRDDTGVDSAGVLAQEVQEVLPEAVLTALDGSLTVAAGPMIGLLVAAVKELANGVAR